jgi:death-on-curing protein
MKYLRVEQVLRTHARVIEKSGGDPGVRDFGLLDSAVAQPRAGFGGRDLYPELADKAAALAFSLVMNHPFSDGNNRTGYAAMMMFLSRNGHTIDGRWTKRSRFSCNWPRETWTAIVSWPGSVTGSSGSDQWLARPCMHVEVSGYVHPSILVARPILSSTNPGLDKHGTMCV